MIADTSTYTVPPPQRSQLILESARNHILAYLSLAQQQTHLTFRNETLPGMGKFP